MCFFNNIPEDLSKVDIDEIGSQDTYNHFPVGERRLGCLCVGVWVCLVGQGWGLWCHPYCCSRRADVISQSPHPPAYQNLIPITTTTTTGWARYVLYHRLSSLVLVLCALLVRVQLTTRPLSRPQ